MQARAARADAQVDQELDRLADDRHDTAAHTRLTAAESRLDQIRHATRRLFRRQAR